MICAYLSSPENDLGPTTAFPPTDLNTILASLELERSQSSITRAVTFLSLSLWTFSQFHTTTRGDHPHYFSFLLLHSRRSSTKP